MKTRILSRLVSVMSATVLIVVMAFPASAAAPRVVGANPAPHAEKVTAVAKITGAGTATMTDVGGTTLWWENRSAITLFSDGSAKGTFYCLDQADAPPGYYGVIWGAVTSWTLDHGLISLHVPSSTVISFPSGSQQDGGSWRIQIQKFGGAGVGHWTLDIPDGNGGWITVCLEQVTDGKIALKRLKPGDDLKVVVGQ